MILWDVLNAHLEPVDGVIEDGSDLLKIVVIRKLGDIGDIMDTSCLQDIFRSGPVLEVSFHLESLPASSIEAQDLRRNLPGIRRVGDRSISSLQVRELTEKVGILKETARQELGFRAFVDSEEIQLLLVEMGIAQIHFECLIDLEDILSGHGAPLSVIICFLLEDVAIEIVHSGDEIIRGRSGLNFLISLRVEWDVLLQERETIRLDSIKILQLLLRARERGGKSEAQEK